MGKYLQDKKFPLTLKKKIFIQTVIPTLLYAAETWTTTKAMESKIRSTQLSMERKTLGITWEDKINNTTIKQKTKSPDVLRMPTTSKWNWKSHAARAKDNRALDIMKWNPILWGSISLFFFYLWAIGKRKRGRPKTRWKTDLVEYSGNNWAGMAEDRVSWSSRREAFVQQWNRDG